MTFQTAPTQFVDVAGVKLAYRRLGHSQNGSVPVLYITHFRGTMDVIDPLLANSIAASRELIVFDNAGVGHSEGAIPDTLHEAAATAVAFLAAINVPQADLLGFSMGGLIAQIIAIEHKELVRKLVLSGTQSSYAEGMVSGAREIFALAGAPDPTEDTMQALFFYPTESSRALGHAWWLRTHERSVAGETPTRFVDAAGGAKQQGAITHFVSDLSFFPKVKELTLPILVTNGKNDVMTPTPNSWLIQQSLPDVTLILYPDSGHGHLYQEPELYAKHLELFLG
ncbi:alpha/beta-hydrolase [Pyrenochaeta sp. DS3sAY3a]|nr:alpha/beta-hydrolase [Pyrenochaeta sp. DS3sAY3a]